MGAILLVCLRLLQLLNGLCSFQHLLRPGAHPEILSQVYPANGAGRIQQELSGPGNVLAINSLPRMDEIVAANSFHFRIGKKSKRVAGLLTEIARHFRGVHADRNRANSCLCELIQTLLNAPQLGVT